MKETSVQRPSVPSVRRRAEHEQIRAIREATLVLLKQNGFENLTMDGIANHAHMSKQTLYKHFASKEALIVDLVQHNATDLCETLGTLAEVSLPLDKLLYRIGDVLLRLLTSEKSILINRIAIAYAISNTQLGFLLFTSGRQTVLPIISRLIKEAMRRVHLNLQNSGTDIGETFIGLLMGDLQIRCLLGVSAPPDESEIHVRVEQAVKQLICLADGERSVAVKN